ncbi:polysaccharide deacetylase family protein [Christensenellaceae bacterium OttesenSCG-928-M15]|nr:polysaccharide deacetylase family protein [Christensenellaceae bacterium OttesenSCG-928-M15]
MKWPDEKRIAVMLAFDLDGESLWEEEPYPANVSNRGRGTYGPVQGMPRLLKLLKEKGTPATFFLPGVTAERYPYIAKAIVEQGHEIGYHGYTHTSHEERALEHADMLKTEKLIYDMTGFKIVGQRGPSGIVYDYTLDLFLEHGYIYSTNWRNDDGPFIHKINGKEVPIVELPKDSIFDDTTYDMYVNRPWQTPICLRSAREFTKIWQDEFDVLVEENRMINFVIHPQFIGHISRINALGRMIDYMKARGAWFETNGNVARHVLKENGFEVKV